MGGKCQRHSTNIYLILKSHKISIYTHTHAHTNISDEYNKNSQEIKYWYIKFNNEQIKRIIIGFILGIM